MAEPQWNEAQLAKLEEQRRYKRAHQRRTVLFKGKVSVNSFSFSCKVLDISLSGARLRLDLPIAVGTAISVAFQDYVPLDAEVVWARDGCIGVKFLDEAKAVHARLGALGDRLATQ